MRPQLWLACALCLASSACRDPQPPAPIEPAPEATPAPTAAAAPAADRSDPGPRLERPVGEKPAVTRPGVALEVDAVEAVDGAVYLRALVPPDPSQVVMGPLDDARLEVLGERHGVAVPAAQGRLPDRPWLYVRLQGQGPPPDPLVIRWRQAALLDGEPGQIQDLTLHGASRAAPFPRLAARVHEAFSRWFGGQRRMRPTAFDAFAAGRMQAWRSAASLPRNRFTQTFDLLALDAGSATPMLMRDRGLGLPADGGGAVPLTDIDSLPASGYPWRALLGEDAKPAEAEPLTAWAPAEWICVQLAGLDVGLALHDDATTLFGPLIAGLTAAPGDTRLLDRLLAGLGLDRPLVKALSPATGRAAVLVTDPLLRDGPGLVVVVEISDRPALDVLLAERDAAATTDRVDRITLAGHAVRRQRGPGIAAHRALIDGVLVLSNSAAAFERVIAARAGERSLGGSDEYRTLRRSVPRGADEVAFAVVGAGQLDHLASPRLRILAARRARALADLRAVGFSGLLYGWLTGRPLDLASAADRAALTASGLLTELDLRHDDGGSITFDDGRACSKTWGCAGAGRPLIDVEATTATGIEAGAYRRFRSDSLTRWRQRFAPMALRVERRGKGFAVSGRMLPLPRLHAWLDIARQLGPAPLVAAGGAGLEVQLALAADAPLRVLVEQQLRDITGQRDVGLSWLGDRVLAGIADRSGIWDGVLNSFELPNTVGRRTWRETGQRKRVLDRLPIYLMAPVADRAALDRALVALRAFAGAAGSPIAMTDGAGYRGVEVIELREVLSEEANRVGFYLGVAGETLVAGIERATFEIAVDRALDGPPGEEPTAAPSAGPQARFSLQLTAGGWLQRALLGALERIELNRITPARRSFAAAHQGAALPAAGPARDAALLRWLGYLPAGPHGDRPEVTEAGDVALPRYGTAVAPSWPAIPVDGDPLTSLATFEASIGFVGAEGRTEMAVELSWTRR